MLNNGMRPVHQGEILVADYIKPMGVSVRAVALVLHVPCEITKGVRGEGRLIQRFASNAILVAGLKAG